MNVDMKLSLSKAIAERILSFVDDVDGPVTLLEIEHHIAGIAQSSSSPSFQLSLPHPTREVFVWDGMTEAGEAALREIIFSRRVAVQFVTPLPYLDGRGCYLERDDWLPIMLLPARGANISGPAFLARLSQQSIKDTLAIQRSGKAAHRLLTPSPLSFSADHFSIGHPQNRFFALLRHATAA